MIYSHYLDNKCDNKHKDSKQTYYKAPQNKICQVRISMAKEVKLYNFLFKCRAFSLATNVFYLFQEFSKGNHGISDIKDVIEAVLDDPFRGSLLNLRKKAQNIEI